jgi:hypothetical protein
LALPDFVEGVRKEEGRKRGIEHTTYRPSRHLRGRIDVYETGRKKCEKRTVDSKRGTCSTHSTLAIESSLPFFFSLVSQIHKAGRSVDSDDRKPM